MLGFSDEFLCFRSFIVLMNKQVFLEDHGRKAGREQFGRELLEPRRRLLSGKHGRRIRVLLRH